MKNNRMSGQVCKCCIMDCSDPKILFDEDGVCNHCHEYNANKNHRVIQDNQSASALGKLSNKIKNTSQKHKYNCIIGVSGGVDSSYVAYYVKRVLGLRPLAIHVDNGWNSNLANQNIENALRILEIPLKTVVLNWKEFSDLQMAFLEANVPDGEIPTDHAINAVLFNEAKKNKVKYVINGMNYRTEAMKVEDWAYGHADWKYIRSVYSKMRGRKLKHYPHFSMLDLAMNFGYHRIKVISILNYLQFDKNEAMTLIERELRYQKYEAKHYESIYTKWFQGYFLVRKFGIDKRRGHMSDLIRSGQLSREEALEGINTEALSSLNVKEVTLYVLKKFRKETEWLENIFISENVTFRHFPNNRDKVMRLKKTYNYLRIKNLVSV